MCFQFVGSFAKPLEVFAKAFLCLVAVTATFLTVEAGVRCVGEHLVEPLVVPGAQPGKEAVLGFTRVNDDGFFTFQDIGGGPERSLVDLKGSEFEGHDFRADPPALFSRGEEFYLSISHGADTVVVDKYNPLTLERSKVASFSDLAPGKLRNVEAFWLASEGKDYQKDSDSEHIFFLKDNRFVDFEDILLNLEIPEGIPGKVVDIQVWPNMYGPTRGKVFYLSYDQSTSHFEILSSVISIDGLSSDGLYIFTQVGTLTSVGTFQMKEDPKDLKQFKFAFGPSSSFLRGGGLYGSYRSGNYGLSYFPLNDEGYPGVFVDSKTHQDFFTLILRNSSDHVPRMVGGVLLEPGFGNFIEIPVGDDSGNPYHGIVEHEISLRFLPDGLIKFNVYLQSDLSEVNLNNDNSIDVHDLTFFVSNHDMIDSENQAKLSDLVIKVGQILGDSEQKTVEFKYELDFDPDNRESSRGIMMFDDVTVENPLYSSAPSVVSENEDLSLTDISLEKLVVLRDIVEEVQLEVGSSGFLSNLLSKIDRVLQNPTDLNRLENTIGEIEILLQNFPNPFNPETWIPVRGLKNSAYKLNIFDSSGNNIRTINLNGGENPSQKVHWDGRNENGVKVSSGVYFYTLEGKDFFATRKMVIVK